MKDVRGRGLAVRTGLALIAIGFGTALLAPARAQKPDEPKGDIKPDLANLKKTFVVPAGEGKDAEKGPVVQAGRRCATAEPSAAQRQRARQGVALVRAGAPGAMDITRADWKVEVKVRFIVIHKGAEGNVTDARLKKQLHVLNTTYNGTGFSFVQTEVVRHDVTATGNDPSWFTMTHGGAAERAAKEKLGKDQHNTLNLYTAKPLDPFGRPLLGWATFPTDFAGDPKRDGVVVLHDTLPDGAAADFNLGKTATHEAGHYLGLYHTFQGGCSEPGDEVEDTPAQSDTADTNGDGIPDIFQAIPGLDTCAKPGLDPIHNYMNYPEDVHLTEFTAGQIARMRNLTTAFRPDLIALTLPMNAQKQLFKVTDELKKK